MILRTVKLSGRRKKNPSPIYHGHAKRHNIEPLASGVYFVGMMRKHNDSHRTGQVAALRLELDTIDQEEDVRNDYYEGIGK